MSNEKLTDEEFAKVFRIPKEKGPEVTKALSVIRKAMNDHSEFAEYVHCCFAVGFKDFYYDVPTLGEYRAQNQFAAYMMDKIFGVDTSPYAEKLCED